ncbi:hypothetical protein ACJJTC_016911 [Scirpophaga incertulas]
MAKKKSKAKISKQSNVVSDASKKVFNDTAVDPKLDIIAAAMCTTSHVVFMKVCRLCESKDGPFLNIFNSDKITAKKIDELMPFGIAENDGLPHKICFRCSAKVEELYEFIQKCIKTQHSLREVMGIKGPLVTKTKERTIWEAKLNKSNMSNDDICDALIKKAMLGIKDIPLNPVPIEEKGTSTQESKKDKSITSLKKDLSNNTIKKEDEEDLPLYIFTSTKESKVSNESKFLPTRSSRSQNATENLLDGLPDPKRRKVPTKPNDVKVSNSKELVVENSKKDLNDISVDYNNSETSIIAKETSSQIKKDIPNSAEQKAKPFNIMDHVSMIRVNDVGVLFQCKLCNRNFLKKEVVLSHACAKNGIPKVDFTKNLVPPAPPKMPVVKYINTRMDDVTKKLVAEEKSENAKIDSHVNKSQSVEGKTKDKPKIGPASKVKRQSNNCNAVIGMTVVPMEEDANSVPQSSTASMHKAAAETAPSIQFPSTPSLNSRYKLLPGPNNTFQLVEEPSMSTEPLKADSKTTAKSVRKRKGVGTNSVESKSRNVEESRINKKEVSVSEVIDLEDAPAQQVASESESQPYPVGLFQTLPLRTQASEPTFTTPAMKKQSYTIVQTGNPSKLLISTKPQPIVEDGPKKRQKKNKLINKPEVQYEETYPVVPEDPATSKDSGFFTFINVDPLLQPSYVLPTDNIIQESQISTSTTSAKNSGDSKDKYSCNMCGETFSREKKLLSHIQSHYSKMDEEDQLRAEKNSKKRGKRN